MGLMTDRNELVRDAYQDDSLSASDRNRLWSTMQHRQTRQARLRNLLRAGALLLAGAILTVVILLGTGVRSTAGPVVVTADSLTINSPSEPPMIQENPEVPSSLIPLLGHRSSLRIDIANAETRRDELVKRLEQTSGREHDRIEQQLASIEQQIEASRLAINVIDRQLTGIQTPPIVTQSFTETPPQVFQFDSPGIPGEVIWAAGGAGGVLLLGMLSLLVYMRHFARSTRQALSLIEGQVSSQHATLASGIDAIALEVERLGEGQRFMSKVLTTPEAKVRPQG
jgi:hypothetical protein